MEKLLQLDASKTCTVASFCEEPRAAYNRVKLTSYFDTREPSNLSMTGDFRPDGKTNWYDESNVELYVGDKAVSIDTTAQIVTGASGQTIPYDVCVLATGSYPFVPPIPGRNRPGVFVYRTIEDLENMLMYATLHNVKAAAVIGGGLLGLEAAKAAADMGLGTQKLLAYAYACLLLIACFCLLSCNRL
jgi:nitrite reductase (NADH) large subunit